MRAWYLSETPYPFVTPATLAAHGTARAALPSALCDPARAADLLHETLDECLLADSLGLDVVVNEHHAGINCLHAASPLLLGILARQTTRARILSLGTLITVRPDPIRIAEEYATADILSRGRLDIGFVKSGGSEMASGDANPVDIEPRFWEAIDLIHKALTTHDGPFSWEGEHFTHRHANVWPRPWQRPHPPYWAATGDAATARELGRRGYVHTVFASGPDRARAAWAAYRAGAAETGRPPAPDRFAAMAFVHVGETDAAARDTARNLLWFLHTGDLSAPQYDRLLPGKPLRPPTAPTPPLTVDQAIDRGILFAGRPETVTRQIEAFRTRAGPFAHLVLMGRSGRMTHAEATGSICRFATHVLPQLQHLPAAAE